MNVDVTGAFVYYTIPIFGGIPITQTTVSSCIVAILLIVLSVVLGKNLKKRPDGKQVLVEKGVTMIYNLTVSVMGEHNGHWMPFMATIFLSSICNSLLGMTGFLRSATADLSCVLTWGVMVSVVIWYNNIKHKGFGGWLKGFTEPIVVMTPMNIVSEIAQPFSMAFRHFGNVAGGGVITTIIYVGFTMLSTAVLGWVSSVGWIMAVILMLAGVGIFLIRKNKLTRLLLSILTFGVGLFGLLQTFGILSGVPVMAFGIPAVLSCYFDLFSGFIQALVFTLLTMVYISGSLPEAGEQKNK